MRILTLSLILLVSLAFQSTILSYFEISDIKPDLILIMIIFNALLQGSGSGALFGFAGGLLQDIMIGQGIGMNALAKTITGYIVGLTEKKVYKENLLTPIVFLLFGTIFNESLVYLLQSLTGVNIGYRDAFTGIILPVALFNSLLAPFFYGKFYASSTKGLLRRIQP